MLILNRKVDQGIVIGEDIRIVVVDVRGGLVKLGIEADKSVRVLREELLDVCDGETRILHAKEDGHS